MIAHRPSLEPGFGRKARTEPEQKETRISKRTGILMRKKAKTVRDDIGEREHVTVPLSTFSTHINLEDMTIVRAAICCMDTEQLMCALIRRVFLFEDNIYKVVHLWRANVLVARIDHTAAHSVHYMVGCLLRRMWTLEIVLEGQRTRHFNVFGVSPETKVFLLEMGGFEAATSQMFSVLLSRVDGSVRVDPESDAVRLCFDRHFPAAEALWAEVRVYVCAMLLGSMVESAPVESQEHLLDQFVACANAHQEPALVQSMHLLRRMRLFQYRNMVVAGLTADDGLEKK